MSPNVWIYRITLLFLGIFGVHCQHQPNLGRTFMTSCGNSSTLTDAYRYGSICSGTFRTWYRDNFQSFYPFNTGDSVMEYQNTTASWDEICRWSRSPASCYEEILPQCDSGIGIELLTDSRFYPEVLRRFNCEVEFFDRASSINAFYRRTCEGAEVKPDIKERIDDTDFNTNMTCLNTTYRVEINQCLRSLREEVGFRAGVTYQLSEAFRQSINRLAGATVNCIFSAINRSPCNQATKRVLYHVAKLQLPAFIDDADLELDETTTADFSSIIRCTVGVYGDPHLKLCEETGLITCSAVGEQVYITNDWFTVTGVNTAIGTSARVPPITTLSSVQITFHSFNSADTVATYSASNGDLPVVFDTANATKQGQGNDEVILTGHEVDRQRRFIQASTGMVLTLRQWSGNYFFTLRVSQSVIKKSHGLLVGGCPSKETINRRNLFVINRRKRATKDECEIACDVVRDDPLKEICIFDCEATQDIDFAVNMTTSAEEDIKMVVELDSELISNAVTLPPTTPIPAPPKATTNKPNSAASHTSLSYSVVLTALLSFLYRSVTH